jgi:hypothetical protein
VRFFAARTSRRQVEGVLRARAEAIASFRTRYPGISVILKDTVAQRALAMVKDGGSGREGG